ncbi:XRE family transcriptional regulator [Jatrophihabitans telluris]|uniref:XRE family transcriptional regulator n=1 Tax=Jatrophihabitans telluris TaxID=2038343 RepID=A0ABY4QUS1_9ACTN|nr:XRE family transcriptional regulator [Jatrophihabitans telluris]UQX87002.1 XRE family transcriptional regulator [Jatrophihabitans telluris]
MTENRATPAEPVVSLGIRLKHARERSGMSLRELARQLGVSPSFVSQLENGKSQPSVATLYSLAQLLEVSIDELFAEEETPEPPTAARHGTVASRRVPEEPAGARVNRSGMGSIADAWPKQAALAKLSVTRPGERHVLEMDSGVIWERLVDNSGTGLDFIEIVYPPHSSSTTGQRMLQHAGSEFGYLLEGELEITVGFDVTTVRAGDAIGFDSAIPHLLANRTGKVARGVWCVRHGNV